VSRRAHDLSQVIGIDHCLEFPFDGLLYRDPAALAALDAAVRTGNIAALQREIELLVLLPYLTMVNQSVLLPRTDSEWEVRDGSGSHPRLGPLVRGVLRPL
jgi:hypothetical protein